jgi:hypothetical protein
MCPQERTPIEQGLRSRALERLQLLVYAELIPSPLRDEIVFFFFTSLLA